MAITVPQLKQLDALFGVVGTGKFASTVTGAIASASTSTETTSTLGAANCAFGDMVTAWIDTSQLGVQIDSYVSAAGVVTIAYANLTGAGQTIGAHNVYYVVYRPIGAPLQASNNTAFFPGDAFV